MAVSGSASPVDRSSGRPTARDIVFLVLLTGILVSEAFLGELTFIEGLKTEHTKTQAELLVAWLRGSAATRASDEFVPAACARKAVGTAQSRNWSDCATSLAGPGGPLNDVRNAFTKEPIGFVKACVPGEAGTVGQMVIEKISTTPPGSAVSTVVAPIAENEPVGELLMLRILVCDKGGYPVKVGEAEF
jgi:hypothetical protein